MSIMGADDSVLEFEDVRINMGIRRDTQRILNCDSANMDRTLTASQEQLEFYAPLKTAGYKTGITPLCQSLLI
jgi:DNA-binding protein WhiA